MMRAALCALCSLALCGAEADRFLVVDERVEALHQNRHCLAYALGVAHKAGMVFVAPTYVDGKGREISPARVRISHASEEVELAPACRGWPGSGTPTAAPFAHATAALVTISLRGVPAVIIRRSTKARCLRN